MARHGTDSNFVIPKASIEGILTVVPTRITDPRLTRQVLTRYRIGPGIFQRCFNVVQYYVKEKEEDSGWLVAGWFKETLATALSEQPMICGRLQKAERNDGELEIVSNDSGVRLIEATIQMNLSEFLDLKQREEAEADQLVFWKDIDEQSPQFSPLFYVQVTNFECGGYSIGISCSILLVDLLLRTKFLQTWANLHNNVVKENNNQKLPLFHLLSLKSASGSSLNLIGVSTSNKSSNKTMIFKTNSESHDLDIEWFKRVAIACVEEAEKKGIGCEMGVEFCLFVKESFEVIKVESCLKHGNGVFKADMQVSYEDWDGLGAEDVCFGQGNKPVRVSYWFRSISVGALIVIPSQEEDQDVYCVSIIVTIPN